jgi:hypothetical protein
MRGGGRTCERGGGGGGGVASRGCKAGPGGCRAFPLQPPTAPARRRRAAGAHARGRKQPTPLPRRTAGRRLSGAGRRRAPPHLADVVPIARAVQVLCRKGVDGPSVVDDEFVRVPPRPDALQLDQKVA